MNGIVRRCLRCASAVSEKVTAALEGPRRKPIALLLMALSVFVLLAFRLWSEDSDPKGGILFLFLCV